ncbi:hypothetical protein PSPO01_08095 [Paraphaeosphaeria sporulosa]
MLSTLLRLFHTIIINIVALLLIIGIFVHEPTFKLFHDGLYDLHIFYRPDHLACLLRPRQLVFSAPTFRPVLPWMSHICTQFVHLSPRLLCYVNGGVVKAGNYVVVVVMGKDSKELNNIWKAAGKDVAGFCKAGSTMSLDV